MTRSLGLLLLILAVLGVSVAVNLGRPDARDRDQHLSARRAREKGLL